MQSSETCSHTLSCIIFFSSFMAIFISSSRELFKRTLHCRIEICRLSRIPIPKHFHFLPDLGYDGIICVQRGTYKEVEDIVCTVPVTSCNQSATIIIYVLGHGFKSEPFENRAMQIRTYLSHASCNSLLSPSLMASSPAFLCSLASSPFWNGSRRQLTPAIVSRRTAFESIYIQRLSSNRS